MRINKEFCTVGAEVLMSDKYLSEGFEGDLPTQPSTKPTASRIVFLPRGILIPLIVLLACVSSNVCSKTFAEEQVMITPKIDRTDQTVQEMGIAKTPEDQPRRKKVLVLNSYHPGYMWSDDLVAGILSVLDDSGRIEVLIEYIDSKRYTGKEYFDRIEEIIRYKHRKEKIDVIIASDHHAVELILRMRSTFHRGIPLVFCGIDDFNWEHRAEYEPIYGLEEKDGGVLGTLDLVFSVHPRLRAVYFVADETKSAQVMLKYVRQAEASQKEGVKFNYLVGMSIAEVETAVREVPADSVVMWLHFVRDKNGRVLPVTESQQWLAEHSPVPVYCPWGFKAGTGVLGGRILSGFTQGKKVAEITLRVIDKQDPQPIPYGQQAPLTTEFDYKVMHRFGIGMDDIPIGSIVHRGPLSAMEKYKWQIISGVVLLIAEALLILFLLFNIKKRKATENKLKAEIEEHKKAKEKLLNSEQRFRSLVENANEAIVVTQDGTVKYGNRQISELTGYTPEELGLRDFFEFIHPEDRETVIREYQTRLSGERPEGNYSIRIVTKDRSEKYVLVNSALIDWEHKPATLAMLTDITDLKKKEWGLLQAQQIAHLGFYDWDFKKDRLYASEELIRIIGKDFEEEYVTSEYIFSVIHPDDLDFVRENLELAIKGEKKYDIEHRILRPDGTVIWVASKAELFRDVDGVPERLVGSGIDITEQKLAREKLLRSEQHFRSLMEQSPLAIELLTPQGQITHVNKAWMQLWGVNEEETAQVLGTYNILTDKEAENRGVLPLIKKAFAGETVVLPPIEYVCKNTVKNIGLDQLNPNTVWIQCYLSPVKNENQEILFVVNTYLDLTDLRQSELQINEMASFAELNPAPVLRINSTGIIVSCNPATQEILGKDAKKGTSVFSMLPNLSKTDIKKCIHGNTILSQEVDIEGRFYLFLLRGVRDLNLLHIYGSDITQRKKVEEEINRLREEYLHIARVAAIGELTASLAHELKQPLAAIRSNAQAAQRFLTGNNPDLDEFHAILTDIIKDNRRADEVIGKLRTLMRKEKIQITELNINELIQGLFPLIHSYEIMRNISLEFEPDDRLPSVAADRVQVQQVILNLFLNSSEALMGVSGDMRKITIQASQKDTHNITVSIKDNGPGIDEQNIDRLFEAFYTTKKEGLGMGLAISRSIIEAHKGSLWAENNSDSGVTFYFTIPIFKRSSV